MQPGIRGDLPKRSTLQAGSAPARTRAYSWGMIGSRRMHAIRRGPGAGSTRALCRRAHVAGIRPHPESGPADSSLAFLSFQPSRRSITRISTRSGN